MRITKKYPASVYLKRFNINICFGNVLIALLVVLIILGVIVGVLVAMQERSSSRSCGGKANQFEGKHYISAMNRAQQAYHLENGAFVALIPKLGLGIQTKTKNYEYSVRATKAAVFNYAIAQKTASKPLKNYVEAIFNYAIAPASKPLKSYVGAVFIVPTSKVGKKAAKNNKETLAILCETDTPTNQLPAEPTYQKGVLACGSNTHSIP